MKVIKRQKLEEFFEAHSQGKNALLKWYAIVKRARWGNFTQLRATFPQTDEVTVASGRKVVIFNIKKIDFRLIAAVHYEKTVRAEDGTSKTLEGKVFVFNFLTHAQYDKELWKARL